MESIPFYFDSVHGGFSSRVDVGGLGLKTDAKEASVALDEIESIEFKRG